MFLFIIVLIPLMACGQDTYLMHSRRGFRTSGGGGGGGGGGSPSYTGPLDIYTGANIGSAWSIARRLTSNYSGRAFTLRRSSDNGLTNVGFLEDGLIDTNGVASWCGTDVGYVACVFDQWASYDLTNQTATHQPTVYTNNVCVTLSNSSLAMKFSNETTKYGLTNGTIPLYTNRPATILCGTAWAWPGSGTSARFASGFASAAEMGQGMNDNGPFLSCGTAVGISTNANWTTNQTWVWSSIWSFAGVTNRFNSASNNSMSIGSFTPSAGIALGSCNGASRCINSLLSEFIYLTNDCTIEQTHILHTNACAFYGTPSP